MNSRSLAPEEGLRLLSRNVPLLAYRNKKKWRKAAKSKLRVLLFGAGKNKTVDPRPLLVKRTSLSYDVTFWSSYGSLVTGRLILPRIGNTNPIPLVICLQGHTLDRKGRSVGVSSLCGEGNPEDKNRFRIRGINIAEQATQEGYAAFALEQCGFGERSDQRDPSTKAFYGRRCHNPAMTSLLHGKTLIGERVRDVSAAISALTQLVSKHKLPIDMARIACFGHSAGGTIAFYAGALDTRIKAVVASGSVCQFKKSIAVIDHCVCNYIPNISTWFELGDIGCLIAPRILLVVHGKTDLKFPIAGVNDAMRTLSAAYADVGFPSSCSLIVGNGGHDFFPKLAWPVFKSMVNW